MLNKKKMGTENIKFLHFCQVQMVIVNLTLEFPDFRVVEIVGFYPTLKEPFILISLYWTFFR